MLRPAARSTTRDRRSSGWLLAAALAVPAAEPLAGQLSARLAVDPDCGRHSIVWPTRHGCSYQLETSSDLKGWSALYKTMKGEGKITCDNGQSAEVTIKTTGGGLTAGKSELIDVSGNFSKVKDISETFGGYAQAEAHAGAVGSSGAQALTKGEVSLALAGTGRGFDLGISFGKFSIQPKGAVAEADVQTTEDEPESIPAEEIDS